MTTLIIAEHDNVSIKGATLNTVAAALQMAADVHVLVAGHNAAPAVQAATQIAGVSKVLHVDAASLADGLAEDLAAQVLAIVHAAAGGYGHVLFAATTGGKNVAPRVAALLDVAQISEITKVLNANTYERPIYAGNAIATVQSSDTVQVLTVRSTGFDAAAATGGNAAVAVVPAVPANGKSSFVNREVTKNDRPELAGGPWAAATSSTRCSRRWPTSSGLRWAPAVRRWMPAMRPTTGRWVRPARSWRRRSTSLPASAAQSSTWPA